MLHYIVYILIFYIEYWLLIAGVNDEHPFTQESLVNPERMR